MVRKRCLRCQKYDKKHQIFNCDFIHPFCGWCIRGQSWIIISLNEHKFGTVSIADVGILYANLENVKRFRSKVHFSLKTLFKSFDRIQIFSYYEQDIIFDAAQVRHFKKYCNAGTENLYLPSWEKAYRKTMTDAGYRFPSR